MDFHGYYTGDPNNWYQSRSVLRESAAAYGGKYHGSHFYGYSHHHQFHNPHLWMNSPNPSPSNPSFYHHTSYSPPPLPNHTIINGHSLPLQFPFSSQILQPMNHQPSQPICYPQSQPYNSYVCLPTPQFQAQSTEILPTKTTTTPPIYQPSPHVPQHELVPATETNSKFQVTSYHFTSTSLQLEDVQIVASVDKSTTDDEATATSNHNQGLLDEINKVRHNGQHHELENVSATPPNMEPCFQMPDLETNDAIDDDLTFNLRKKGTPPVCENGTKNFVNLAVKLDSASRVRRTKQATEPMVMNADKMLKKISMPWESQIPTEAKWGAMLDKELDEEALSQCKFLGLILQQVSKYVIEQPDYLNLDPSYKVNSTVVSHPFLHQPRMIGYDLPIDAIEYVVGKLMGSASKYYCNNGFRIELDSLIQEELKLAHEVAVCPADAQFGAHLLQWLIPCLQRCNCVKEKEIMLSSKEAFQGISQMTSLSLSNIKKRLLLAGKTILKRITGVIDRSLCAMLEFGTVGTVATLNAWLSDTFTCASVANKWEKMSLLIACWFEEMDGAVNFFKDCMELDDQYSGTAMLCVGVTMSIWDAIHLFDEVKRGVLSLAVFVYGSLYNNRHDGNQRHFNEFWSTVHVFLAKFPQLQITAKVRRSVVTFLLMSVSSSLMPKELGKYLDDPIYSSGFKVMSISLSIAYMNLLICGFVNKYFDDLAEMLAMARRPQNSVNFFNYMFKVLRSMQRLDFLQTQLFVGNSHIGLNELLRKLRSKPNSQNFLDMFSAGVCVVEAAITSLELMEKKYQIDPVDVEPFIASVIIPLHLNEAAEVTKGMGKILRVLGIYTASNHLVHHPSSNGQEVLIEHFIEILFIVPHYETIMRDWLVAYDEGSNWHGTNVNSRRLIKLLGFHHFSNNKMLQQHTCLLLILRIIIQEELQFCNSKLGKWSTDDSSVVWLSKVMESEISFKLPHPGVFHVGSKKTPRIVGVYDSCGYQPLVWYKFNLYSNTNPDILIHVLSGYNFAALYFIGVTIIGMLYTIIADAFCDICLLIDGESNSIDISWKSQLNGDSMHSIAMQASTAVLLRIRVDFLSWILSSCYSKYNSTLLIVVFVDTSKQNFIKNAMHNLFISYNMMARKLLDEANTKQVSPAWTMEITEIITRPVKMFNEEWGHFTATSNLDNISVILEPPQSCCQIRNTFSSVDMDKMTCFHPSDDKLSVHEATVMARLVAKENSFHYFLPWGITSFIFYFGFVSPLSLYGCFWYNILEAALCNTMTLQLLGIVESTRPTSLKTLGLSFQGMRTCLKLRGWDC